MLDRLKINGGYHSGDNTAQHDLNQSKSEPVVTGMPAICISQVKKRYRIFPTSWDRLRDALGLRSNYKEFDALCDISFDIYPGEFWGILGKNGSGKSTLLKIVAGQLQPTNGTIETNGRLTLLQLGLGFDPELTGLENVKHSRILQNLTSDFEDVEEFVKDFSELGDFINYPVKTYSSGMYSRLAFASAIAGNPDILIADEVLAVGDMNFSQKCLAKMREFKEAGKTVVLVTHDVNTVKSFCDQAVWLNNGNMIILGPAKLVADDFRNYMLYGVISNLSSQQEQRNEETADSHGEGRQPNADPDSGPAASEDKKLDSNWITPNPDRRTVSSGSILIERYRFLDALSRTVLASWFPGKPLEFQILFRAARQCLLHSFAFTLHDRNGLIALHLNSEFFGTNLFEPNVGTLYQASFRFDVPLLQAGDYSISFGCSEGQEGVITEKYDYDSTVTIQWEQSPLIAHQSGYVIVPAGSFQYQVQTDI